MGFGARCQCRIMIEYNYRNDIAYDDKKEGGSENKYSEIYRTGYFYRLARKKRKKNYHKRCS